MSERTVNIIRWVMLLPVSIMISGFAYEIVLTITVFLPYSKGGFWIDQSLLYFGRFLSGFLLVYAGFRIAPHYKIHAAIILAVIVLPILAVYSYVTFFTHIHTDQPLSWSVYQHLLQIEVAIVLGGVVAAFLIYRFQKKKDTAQVEEQYTENNES